jgi:nitrogen fixation protein NifU and related proteins
MDSKLSQLYQGVIMQHNNEPFHFEKRATAQHVIEAYNPLCGDKFKLFLDIENGVVTQATFHGYGCAISKASTSLLMKNIQGQPLSKIADLVSDYFKIIENRSENTDEELTAFAAAKDFPGRIKCATLAWDSINEFISTVPPL